MLGIKCSKAFPLLVMYLQNEHYALWEVIEFGDSYKAPSKETGKGPASESSAKKKGRTVAITTEDMQKRRNDVKARTNLLLALPDEHQLRFSKYETAKELWERILKTFETLEQTFNRLQAIVSHLEFMDVEIEQDNLNQKFLTSLAPEWLMYTIVLRNRDDLDTMSLDDAYNHLKVYEPEVQKKSESNSQNMAFVSSSNTSSGKGKVHTASVPTTSTQVSTASTDSYMANEEENHALVADDEVLTEFALMAKSSLSSDNEEGLRYSAVPPPSAQIYSPPKKDLSWTGLPEFVDDTVTDYRRPTPNIDASKCNKSELQSSNFLFLSMKNQQ
nr:ribonuclease H-like domain-containing protein [Tanacetum cinerariifolium]